MMIRTIVLIIWYRIFSRLWLSFVYFYTQSTFSSIHLTNSNFFLFAYMIGTVSCLCVRKMCIGEKNSQPFRVVDDGRGTKMEIKFLFFCDNCMNNCACHFATADAIFCFALHWLSFECKERHLRIINCQLCENRISGLNFLLYNVESTFIVHIALHMQQP